MRFTAPSLAFVLAVSCPFLASAFVPSTPTTSHGVVSTLSKNSAASAVLSTSSLCFRSFGCSCPGCMPSAVHPKSCPCNACATGVSLRMSEDDSAAEEPVVVEAVAEEAAEVVEAVAEVAAEVVPVEVEAADGVADKEEAHNADRPARASGIKKHNKSGANNKPGTPLAELEIGSKVTGTVKAIQSYGAFLDIGAQTDALLHVSRLSDEFVSNVEDVVKQGQTVEVRIVSVDAEKGQIAVTMRSEAAESQAADRQSSGGKRKDRPRRSGGDRGAQLASLKKLVDIGLDDEKFVEGNVVSVLDFGAFVRFDTSQLAEGAEGEVDGLVHISALSVGRTDSVTSVCNVGDTVQIRVRSIDQEAGKVSLSMISKADEPKPREKGGRARAPRARWSPDEMGAADWKESMNGLEQPSFANSPAVMKKF